MPACLPACLPFTHTLCCSLDLISLPLRALPPCGCHVHAAIILVVVPAKVGLSCVCNPIRAASCMFSLLGCTVSCVHCLQAWPPVQQPLVCAAMYSSYVQLPHPLKRLQNSHCLACVMYENRRMHQPNQCVGMSGDQLHSINTSECPYCAGVLRELTCIWQLETGRSPGQYSHSVCCGASTCMGTPITHKVRSALCV